MIRIRASKIFINGEFVEHHAMCVEADRIRAIMPVKDQSCDIDFGSDSFMIPGMLDLHIHGASGADVMDAMPEALETISDTLAQEGVTGFLATTMSESVARIEAALLNIAAFSDAQTGKGAALLGAHLEGPFLSEKYMGAQCADFLRSPDSALLQKWHGQSGKRIRLITLAPELPGALQFIEYACSLGIVTSIGHTNATYAQSEAAANAGVCYATHLFNAMSGVHHREPGAAAAILADDRITAELIADGHHVAPVMLKFAARCKGIGHLTLVTDAMRAKCLKNGEYELGGQAVVVNEGTARLKSRGSLAGSVLRLNQALRNFVKFTGCSLPECIPMVTETPARLLKLDHEIGTLSPSKKADLVILNNNLDVLMTMRAGKIIYQRS